MVLFFSLLIFLCFILLAMISPYLLWNCWTMSWLPANQCYESNIFSLQSFYCPSSVKLKMQVNKSKCLVLGFINTEASLHCYSSESLQSVWLHFLFSVMFPHQMKKCVCGEQSDSVTSATAQGFSGRFFWFLLYRNYRHSKAMSSK